MNRSIYFKELKLNRKSFILWTSILIFICILLTALYPQVAGDMKALLSTKMVSENMQEFFGMRMDLWTNVLNYFSTYYGFHVIILSGIFSIVVGSTIIAREEGDGTADFLLTRPLTRHQIVLSKLSAYLTLLIALHIILSALILVMFTWVQNENGYNMKSFWVMEIYGFMLNLFFGLMGMFLSVLIKRGRSFVGPGVGIVLGSYTFEAISRIDDSVKWLGYISPFYFVDFKVYETDYGFTWWMVLFLLVSSAAFTYATFKVYSRKDIYA